MSQLLQIGIKMNTFTPIFWGGGSWSVWGKMHVVCEYIQWVIYRSHTSNVDILKNTSANVMVCNAFVLMECQICNCLGLVQSMSLTVQIHWTHWALDQAKLAWSIMENFCTFTDHLWLFLKVFLWWQIMKHGTNLNKQPLKKGILFSKDLYTAFKMYKNIKQ